MKLAMRRTAWLAVALMAVVLAVAIPQAHAAEPSYFNLVVNQTFTNQEKDPAPHEEFSYSLTSKGKVSPLPHGAHSNKFSFAVSGTAEVEIAAIPFTEPGIYTYDLICEDAGQSGYTYDSQVYTIEIYVHSGNEIDIVIFNSAGEKVDRLDFNHSYQKEPDNPENPPPPGSDQKSNSAGDRLTSAKYPEPETGDNSNVIFWGIMLLASSGILVLVSWYRKRKEKSN